MSHELPQQPLAPGTLVLCRYRFPSASQPWIHEFHVGAVQAQDPVRSPWGGPGSEAEYCAASGTVPVQYPWRTEYEHAGELIPITEEEAGMSHRDKIGLFLGPDALAAYDRAMHTGPSSATPGEVSQ